MGVKGKDVIRIALSAGQNRRYVETVRDEPRRQTMIDWGTPTCTPSNPDSRFFVRPPRA